MSAVAGNEYVLKDGEVIITCTDPSSYITYANQAFLDSSGYSLAECVGQPQNLVRHPDMPKAAFADLWATIKAGKPWTGFVKNRRKNGDFYWVRANVTPIKEGGRIVGYVSVRTKPSRADVAAAEKLYAAMRAGSLRGVRLQGGELIPTGVRGLFSAFMSLPLGTRGWLIMGAIAGLLALAFAMSFVVDGAAAMAAFRWAVAIAVPMLLGYVAYLSAAVDRPIEQMLAATTEALAGNLEIRYPTSGDPPLRRLSRYLSQLNDKTTGVVSDTGTAIVIVKQSAHELDRDSADMSSRTEEQAASLEETAATMEQISSGLKHSSDGAQNATRVAAEASAAAAKGGKAIDSVTGTMDGITRNSRRIADIIAVIDGIAFQTNILALNAAVEAARAGEQGRGFAVVAAEVRALAQRSGNAAREIRGLIDESVRSVDEGANRVAEAHAAMKDILAQVKRVADFVGEIALGTQEQAQGVGQVNDAVAQLDQVTQGNAVLASRTAESASSLSAQADRLEDSLRVLLRR